MKCSPTTGAALWYGDLYDGTVPMGKMPGLENIPEGKAVIKPRSEELNLIGQCGVACHNGVYPKGFAKDNRPCRSRRWKRCSPTRRTSSTAAAASGASTAATRPGATSWSITSATRPAWDGQKNTMQISGRLNRTAERYMELIRHHGLALSEPERRCLVEICGIGFMSPLEIRELPLEVELSRFEAEGLDKPALPARLRAATFADLVAVVESLGF